MYALISIELAPLFRLRRFFPQPFLQASVMLCIFEEHRQVEDEHGKAKQAGHTQATIHAVAADALNHCPPAKEPEKERPEKTRW